MKHHSTALNLLTVNLILFLNENKVNHFSVFFCLVHLHAVQKMQVQKIETVLISFEIILIA